MSFNIFFKLHKTSLPVNNQQNKGSAFFYINRFFIILLIFSLTLPVILHSTEKKNSVKKKSKAAKTKSAAKTIKTKNTKTTVKTKKKTASAKNKKTKTEPIKKQKNQSATIKQPKQTKELIIVIDPGHGGMDPGAVSGGVREKDITFRLAKKIKNAFASIDLHSKYKVLLTRDSDKRLSLNSRKNFAKKNNADIFISLHMNIAPNNPAAQGIEIYFVTEEAASGAELKELVDNENSADSDDSETQDAQTEEETAFIFADLQKRSTINKSIQLAVNLEKSLNSLEGTKIRYIRRAPFSVLKNLTTPSLLIEFGFLSNDNDRNIFSTEEFLDKITKNFMDGIISYEQNTLKKIEYPFSDTTNETH